MKPLAALEKIKEITSHREQGVSLKLKNDYVYAEELRTIEKALIENATLNYLLRGVTYTFEKEDFTLEQLGKKLKALEIIKETPEFAWYVKIYENAYEMIADVKSFRLDESAEELQKKFDLLKEVLK